MYICGAGSFFFQAEDGIRDAQESRGLGDVIRDRLKGIDDISINRFTDKDVVRHKLVQDIILAYEKYNKKGM